MSGTLSFSAAPYCKTYTLHIDNVNIYNFYTWQWYQVRNIKALKKWVDKEKKEKEGQSPFELTPRTLSIDLDFLKEHGLQQNNVN